MPAAEGAQRDRKRGGVRSSRTAHPADEKAVAPAAQGVFRGGVSSVAPRSRRSVTASAQALDHSLPGKPESSLPPLGLLSPREPLRWVRAGALNAGRPPRREVGAGAHTRPQVGGAFRKTLRQAGEDGRPHGPPLRRVWRIAAAGRCGQKANCPSGAREAALGCRPLRRIYSWAVM